MEVVTEVAVPTIAKWPSFSIRNLLNPFGLERNGSAVE